MYVQASINIPFSAALVVPSAAIMDTGTRQVVWVESETGVFRQREVKSGVRSGKNVQILSGLKAGEKVAITGGYLIDSEAQLNRSGDESTQPHSSQKLPVAQPAHNDLDMKDMKMQ
jgi:Cu(I)/Ag(I) efflux system membrane fusion protein